MRSRDPRHRVHTRPTFAPPIDQHEEWIKDNVRTPAQTQCTKCDKWISKYWHSDSNENNPMYKCGPCLNK